MKRRIFKKFYEIDFNDYYYAILGDDLYYGVASNYYYATKFLGFKIHRKEEQFFKTIKLPFVLMMYLNRFLHKDEDTVDGEWSLVAQRGSLETGMMTELSGLHDQLIDRCMKDESDNHTEELKKIKEFVKEQTLLIQSRFSLDWNSDVINAYLNDGWIFLFSEYSGTATQQIWLGMYMDDIFNVVAIKLLGKPDRNRVVDLQNIILNTELISAFLDAVQNKEVQK